MNSPMIVNNELQDAADSAYARQIWYETTKMRYQHVLDNVTINNLEEFNFASDTIVNEFKPRCESGFFDVKRQARKGE